jgi:glycosyltransferase involved in cell wall biosynthesis
VRYAAGKEYYVVAVEEPKLDLINLLKAFSQFKKRQQSNMQMIFAGEGLKKDFGFIEKLETYKYRSDVHVYDDISEHDFIKLISASYAFIQPFNNDETGALILNAFKANVPVIAIEKENLREIAADAVLYADMSETESLANQLMLLYKDESLRAQLIEKGKLQWRKFSWERTIHQLHNLILQQI